MKRKGKKRANAQKRATKIRKKHANLQKKQRRRRPHRPSQPPKICMKTTAKAGITAHAGLVPVMKYLEEALKFRQTAEEVVTFERGANAQYAFVDMVQLVMLGVIGGANSIVGVVRLCADVVFHTVAGWIRIPHNSVLGRIFSGSLARHIAQLETLVHTLRVRAWRYASRKNAGLKLPQRTMWIDCDSTEDMVCGHQEGAEKGYNTKKRGARSYHPLLAFCVETKEILQGWFRCGSAYTSNGIVEFMKQLWATLPQGMRVVFRGDSGFFVGELLELCESRGDGYLVKAKLYPNLMAALLRQTWTPVKGQPGWEECRFSFRCDTWTTTRPFMAVRKALTAVSVPCSPPSAQGWLPGLELPEPEPEAGYEYFCYVTTEALTPWHTHKKYGQRATCETWIEEAKSQMGLGHLRTECFLANAALFQCVVLAYNVLRWMGLCCPERQVLRCEPNTLRTWCIRVAGTITVHAGRISITTAPNLFPDLWAGWLAIVDL